MAWARAKGDAQMAVVGKAAVGLGQSKGKALARERRDVEDLVIWALLDNGLGNELVEKAGRLTWQDYGTTIQSSGGGWSGSGARMQHADAGRIVERILALPDDPVTGEPVMAELLIRHGRTNCRPDWCEEGVGSAEQKTNKRGQPEWNYERPDDRKSKKLGPKMVWVGETQAAVEWYRARYAVWWIALKELVAPFNEVLERFEATGPRAMERPWEGRRVFGPDGQLMTGMHGEDASLRLARLARRGPLELVREAEAANSQAMESAGGGGGHGRS